VRIWMNEKVIWAMYGFMGVRGAQSATQA
jgi:hypothetical protein